MSKTYTIKPLKWERVCAGYYRAETPVLMFTIEESDMIISDLPWMLTYYPPGASQLTQSVYVGSLKSAKGWAGELLLTELELMLKEVKQ